MSNTATLNIANLQVFAEAVAAADRAAGTFEANHASDSHYYIWQSDFQTIPMGMNGNPEQFVAQMVNALPGINCIRIPFNIHSFSADGTLDPLFERFLVAAAHLGLQLIPVLAEGDAQQFEGTSAEIAEALAGDTFSAVRDGWQLMKAWMEAHPKVEAAVYGYELLNEPAAYRQAVTEAAGADRAEVHNEMVALYVEHMEQLAGIVSAGSDAKILVSAWGYGGDTQTLEDTFVSGESAIDALRRSLGDDLVWSLHYYPGWMGTTGITDPVELQARWADFMAPLAGDDIVFTEINAPGTTTYNPFQNNQVTSATALSLAWLKAEGVGIGWFPALQTGSSGLAFIESDGDIRYLNQPSLAAALDAFSVGQETTENNLDDFIRPNLIAAALRNQKGDLDYLQGRMDPVDFAGFGFGHGGSDTLVGSDFANNFLYGGLGDDFVGGCDHDDFLFGQDGNDFVASGNGIDHIFGGNGDDTLVGDFLNDTAYGGRGADLFVLAPTAKMTVVDFSSAEQDTWMGTSSGRYLGHNVLDANNDGVADLQLTLSDGAAFLFLSSGETFGILDVLSGQRSFSNLATQNRANLLALSSVGSTFADAEQLGHLEQLSAGGRVASNLPGSLKADSLVGGASNDHISSLAGSDLIFGHEGDDSIDGGSGLDLLYGGFGADRIFGGTGEDSVLGGMGQDRIYGGTGSDFLAGDDGADLVDGGDGEDAISGGGGKDTIVGGIGADIVSGGAEDDSIQGGIGNDSIYGDSGNDIIETGAGNDWVYGGIGNDTGVFYSPGSLTIKLFLNTFQDTGWGSKMLIGLENLVSGAGNDLLIGNLHDNSLNGESGHDTLNGRGGKDSLYGGLGNDILRGGEGSDKLSGGAGNDRVLGGVGNDSLSGGAGHDRLTGGSGADSFLFNSTLGAFNRDRIVDFDGDEDTILLENAVFKGLANGELSTSRFVANRSGLATDAHDRIIYETDTGRLYFDLDGSGSGSRLLFAQLSPREEMSGLDFYVI